MPRRRESHEMSDSDLEEINYILEGPHRTAYHGRFEPEYWVENMLEMPSYDLEDERMKIHDVVWGSCEIGDEEYDPLLMRLARTPLFRRLQAVEQLTLGPEYSTMPNTSKFSRWQHIWGSLAFVRKMTDGDERFTERERIVLQLRTLFSDVGQTSFSHLGDWLFQGIQGGEDLHDQDLKALLRANNIEEMLAEYGLTIEETVFPDDRDWVECPAPALCVDRVDYGMREILRWGTPTIPLFMLKNKLDDPKRIFEINDNKQLVVKDMEFARYFAAGFGILPTEHWAHPVHRIQLELLQSSVRSALVEKLDVDFDHNPREFMYGIDMDFAPYFAQWQGLFIDETMKDIGKWQRKIFVEARRSDLDYVFRGIQNPEWEFPDFPDPMTPYTWKTEHYGTPTPPNVTIHEVDEHKQELAAGMSGLDVYLPSMKSRSIDPLVKINGEVAPLSAWEPSYKKFLNGQKQCMKKSYKATIHMRPDVAEKIVASHYEVSEVWQEMLKRPRDDDALREVIQDSETWAAGHCFDYISER